MLRLQMCEVTSDSGVMSSVSTVLMTSTEGVRFEVPPE